MSQSYVFGLENSYIPETQKKIYWEIIVKENKVMVIQRGGPLEPCILTLTGENIDVNDWWGWGQG